MKKSLWALLLGACLWLGALVPDASAAARFLICSTTCAPDASSTAFWSATSGGATGASVPGSADTVTMDANTCVGGTTCTATFASGWNPTWSSLTFGACTASTTGCILDFATNSNNVTITGAMSGTGTGTRTFSINGTWTMSAPAGSTVWNMTTVTGLTFNANSSNIVLSGNATATRNFLGGGLTYGTVTFNTVAAGGATAVSGSNTFNTLTVGAPNYVTFTFSTTNTINTALNITGSSGAPVTLASSTVGTNATISSALTLTPSWNAFRNFTFSGAGSLVSTNCFDQGQNTGFTCTAPSGGGGGGSLNRILGGGL